MYLIEILNIIFMDATIIFKLIDNQSIFYG